MSDNPEHALRRTQLADAADLVACDSGDFGAPKLEQAKFRADEKLSVVKGRACRVPRQTRCSDLSKSYIRVTAMHVRCRILSAHRGDRFFVLCNKNDLRSVTDTGFPIFSGPDTCDEAKAATQRNIALRSLRQGGEITAFAQLRRPAAQRRVTLSYSSKQIVAAITFCLCQFG